jgi:hypothetical protein
MTPVKRSIIDGGILASSDLIIPTGCVDGYATEFNRQQHVNFIGSNLHVYELFHDNQWHLNDLTQLAGAPVTDPASVFIDGYATEFDSQQHVNFIGTDSHVHELLYDGAWHHNDLTQLTGAPAAAPPQPIDGYSTEFNRQQHVNFIGNDNHVHELYYDCSWHHNDLTQLTGAPTAPFGSYLDGELDYSSFDGKTACRPPSPDDGMRPGRERRNCRTGACQEGTA